MAKNGRSAIRSLAVLIGTVLAGGPLAAVDLEDLISPGELIEAHAREVKGCGDCHQRFDPNAQNALCLACHQPVKQDLESSQGFHGRMRVGPDASCSACHSEHRGADAEIAPVVPETFDHSATDLPLEGAHVRVPCASCHPADRLHREAGNRCFDCHGDADPHEGRLGDDCERCHSPASWSQERFDHGETRFPLEGAHARVECALCHPGERFERVSSACADCHRIDDAHGGRLGDDCGKCHDAAGWKKTGFDHGRRTGFALTGRHAALTCQDCHTREPSQQKLPETCVGCHRADDEHAGGNGTRCESCHDARAWKPARFDHARDTSWALHGAHVQVACSACHVEPLGGAKTPERCDQCHRSVDVHEGSLGRDCERCHGVKSWRESVRFDHDLTRFPLLGLHQLATCEDCHVSHRFTEASDRCADCHRTADVHQQRLGPGCETCHNPNDWGRWQFDHDSQTSFALLGAHRELHCEACHREKVDERIELASSCRSCHLRDSPHSDAFGRDCERCHGLGSWQEILPGARR